MDRIPPRSRRVFFVGPSLFEMGERAWHISPSSRLAEPGAHVEDAPRRDVRLGPLPRSTAHAWPGDAAIAHFTANSAVNCACVPPATRRLRTSPRIARSTAHACPDDAAVAHFTAFLFLQQQICCQRDRGGSITSEFIASSPTIPKSPQKMVAQRRMLQHTGPITSEGRIVPAWFRNRFYEVLEAAPLELAVRQEQAVAALELRVGGALNDADTR
jgi:hypothetical protein